MFPQKENIVVFPFMAQGHIIPFLSLALKLEQQKGFSITFINTPLNIKKLENNLPFGSSCNNIRFIEIPFDSAKHGLPPNSETTETLPLPLMIRLIECSSSLKPAFRALVENLVQKPVCIISDMFFGWTADVAHEFGISHAIFNAGGGFGMAGWHTMLLNLPHLESESDEFWLPGFPKGYTFKAKNLPEDIRRAEVPWAFGVEMFGNWKKTDAMLFNTLEEIDHTGLTYFREQFPNCSVYAIGPVLSSAGSKARSAEETQGTINQCMEWLDSKPESSVLYVAFGSQFVLSETQSIVLANALEASNVNFIWAFRQPLPDSSSSEVMNNDYFPMGFEDRIRISNKGLLLKKWAPQMEILSHESIGAFLSHCGWNSIIEALSNGVPMLSWPMGAEQPFNVKLLEEEMRLCVGVANGASNEVKYEEVAKKIELMIKDEEGDATRRKARKVKEMIENATNDEEGSKGSSTQALDEFLDTLFRTRNNRTLLNSDLISKVYKQD